MAERYPLRDAVRELLFKRWDPIGINDEPLVRNEYDSYAPQIWRMLRDGADETKIAHHQRKLRTNSMGLAADDEHDRLIARELIALVNEHV